MGLGVPGKSTEGWYGQALVQHIMAGYVLMSHVIGLIALNSSTDFSPGDFAALGGTCRSSSRCQIGQMECDNC